MGAEMYIGPAHVHTVIAAAAISAISDGSLGRPPAAPARAVERGRGVGGIDHRGRDLSHAGGDRRPCPRAGFDARGVGVGRAARAVRCALLLNVTTAAKYAALALLVLLAFVVGQGSFGHFAEAGGPVQGGLFGLALVSVMWAYDGWGDLSFVGGEVRDPERNLPRALMVGTGAVVAIYLLVNAAYLYLIPIGAMMRSPLVAADAAQAIVGRLGVGLVAIVVMVATFSTLLGSMLTAPRIFFAMADDGLLFRRVARVHPTFRTPSVAIVLTGLLGIVYVAFQTFQQLADQFVVAIFPFYALAAAAVFVLRRRRPPAVAPRAVRVLGYPVVPALFVLATLYMLGNALWQDPLHTGLAFLIILAGVPVYQVWLRPSRGGSA